jgi:hypothetical protein
MLTTTCGACGVRPAVNPGATCGNSYCQEAAYYVNSAKNTRGRAKADAQRIAGQKVAIAAERADGGVR